MYKTIVLVCGLIFSTVSFAADLVESGAVNEIKISHYELKLNSDVSNYVVISKQTENSQEGVPVNVLRFDTKEIKKMNELLKTTTLNNVLKPYGDSVKKGDSYTFNDIFLNGSEMLKYSTKKVFLVNEQKENISEEHILGLSYIDAHKFLLYYANDLVNIHTGIESPTAMSVPVSDTHHIMLTNVITEPGTKIIGIIFRDNTKEIVDVFTTDTVF